MSLQDRIAAFDFDTAQPHDLAVLLEQVFMYHDARSKDGGPIMVAQGVIGQYEASVRRRAEPELHTRATTSVREMRDALVQFETSLRKLERGSGQARP
jgi:hypothetical protein